MVVSTHALKYGVTLTRHIEFGLFETPGRKFEALIRFSNAAGIVGPDVNEEKEHGSRGMAIKVLDVDGPVLLDDKGRHNQDFLMVNSTAFAIANAGDYLRLNQIILRDDEKPDAFFCSALRTSATPGRGLPRATFRESQRPPESRRRSRRLQSPIRLRLSIQALRPSSLARIK